jgi:hypothetical protein
VVLVVLEAVDKEVVLVQRTVLLLANQEHFMAVAVAVLDMLVAHRVVAMAVVATKVLLLFDLRGKKWHILQN